jgi:YHS domain-containing protein
MRGLLIFIALVLAYYALKSIFRSALSSYHEQTPRGQIKGEDMVLDPQCRTYVIKDRAITRRINGANYSFCSEACASKYEEAHRR